MKVGRRGFLKGLGIAATGLLAPTTVYSFASKKFQENYPDVNYLKHITSGYIEHIEVGGQKLPIEPDSFQFEHWKKAGELAKDSLNDIKFEVKSEPFDFMRHMKDGETAVIDSNDWHFDMQAEIQKDVEEKLRNAFSGKYLDHRDGGFIVPEYIEAVLIQELRDNSILRTKVRDVKCSKIDYQSGRVDIEMRADIATDLSTAEVTIGFDKDNW